MDQEERDLTGGGFNGHPCRSLFLTPESPFREALRFITGEEPPEFVRGYDCRDLEHELQIDELQEWCLNASHLAWMTGIGVLEAAEHLVKCAEENGNIGCNPRTRWQYGRPYVPTAAEWEAGREAY